MVKRLALHPLKAVPVMKILRLGLLKALSVMTPLKRSAKSYTPKGCVSDEIPVPPLCSLIMSLPAYFEYKRANREMIQSNEFYLDSGISSVVTSHKEKWHALWNV